MGLLRSATFNHGRLTFSPVCYGILNTFFASSYIVFRSLTVLSLFYYVCHVMLCLSRCVKFKNIKWHGMGTRGDKFLHIGAFTIVNNRGHMLIYVIAEEKKRCAILLLQVLIVLHDFRIWDHLINIACHNGKQTTIILTTHYIEEARQADKVT